MSTQYIHYPATGGGSDGANTALSNLTSPTAINQNLTFADNGSDNVIASATGSTRGIEILADNPGGVILGSGSGLLTVNQDFISLVSNSDWTGSIELAGSETNLVGPGDGVTAPSLRLFDAIDNNYIAFKAPLAVTASKVFTLPDGDGSNGDALTTNGSGTLSWSAAGSGANITLSNLSATTAISQNLVPGTTNTISVGSSSKLLSSVYVGSSGFGVQLQNGILTTGNLHPNQTTPSGVTGAAGILGHAASSLGSPVLLGTGNEGSATANATGNIYIESGNKTGGTGNSGSINITTGTSLGGTRGAISMSALYLGLPTGSADPTAPEGSIYYNTGTHKIRWYNGSAWADLA